VSIGMSVAPRGALSATKAKRTNVVGTPITSVAKSGTPLVGTYLCSFEVRLADGSATENVTILRITPLASAMSPRVYEIAAGATHVDTIIKGLTIVLGGTINNKDVAYIEVLDDEDAIGRWSITAITATSSQQVKASPGAVGFAHLLWTAAPTLDFSAIFYDDAAADATERFRLTHPLALYPATPPECTFGGGLDFVNGVRVKCAGDNFRLLVGWA